MHRGQLRPTEGHSEERKRWIGRTNVVLEPWPGKCLPEPYLSRRRQRTFYHRLLPAGLDLLLSFVRHPLKVSGLGLLLINPSRAGRALLDAARLLRMLAGTYKSS